MSELSKIFNYAGNEVQTVVRDGDIWFVAKGIAEILEFKDAWSMTQTLDEDEKLNLTLQGLGQSRRTTCISEAGLYSAIMRSRKPEAKAFKRWVTHEVLPSIRKHGAYMTDNALEQAISNPDFMIGLLTELKVEKQKRIETQKENDKLKPKAEKYDEFLDSKGLTTFTVVGKHFLNGMTAQQVRKFLQEKGVLFKKRTDDTYPPKHGYERYFRIIPYIHNGVISARTLKVTSEGIDFIVGLYSEEAV